jgi:hypothetical protein
MLMGRNVKNPACRGWFRNEGGPQRNPPIDAEVEVLIRANVLRTGRLRRRGGKIAPSSVVPANKMAPDAAAGAKLRKRIHNTHYMPSGTEGKAILPELAVTCYR